MVACATRQCLCVDATMWGMKFRNRTEQSHGVPGPSGEVIHAKVAIVNP
jgi:hypothetical protein